MTKESEFIKESKQIVKLLKQMQNLYKKMSELPSDSFDSMISRKKYLEKFIKLIKQTEKELLHFSGSLSVHNVTLQHEYESTLELLESKKPYFGKELSEKLKDLGLELSGQLPYFWAGVFKIVPDFKKEKVIIWYGNEKEHLCTIPLTVEGTLKAIERERQKLGLKISFDEFLDIAKNSYLKLKDKDPKRDFVPIVEFFEEIKTNMMNKYKKKIRRADFSYQIYVYSKNIKNFTDFIELKIATRAQTKDKSNFIWIPNDNNLGVNYSTIKIKRG